MKLSSGVLFDRRYRLIENLGSGASAKVWLALDTLANNLKVAVKIFSAGEGIVLARCVGGFGMSTFA